MYCKVEMQKIESFCKKPLRKCHFRVDICFFWYIIL